MPTTLRDGLLTLVKGPHGQFLGTSKLNDALQSAAAKADRDRQDARGGDRFRNGVKRVRALMEMCVQQNAWGSFITSEGAFPPGLPGRANVRVFAVKGDQYRVYGGYVDY